MAATIFAAGVVIEACNAAVARLEKDHTETIEKHLKEIMSVERVRWEWRSLLPHRVKYHLDREAAVLTYASNSHWTALWYADRIASINNIIVLARAAKREGSAVRLSDVEVSWLRQELL